MHCSATTAAPSIRNCSHSPSNWPPRHVRSHCWPG
jgi:hypothetical protein